MKLVRGDMVKLKPKFNHQTNEEWDWGTGIIVSTNKSNKQNCQVYWSNPEMYTIWMSSYRLVKINEKG